MANTSVIQAENITPWMEVLNRIKLYDFYHLPTYHLMHRKQEEQGVLFVYEENDITIALPLLLRPLQGFPGVPAACSWYDATSVYGYCGPLSNKRSTDIKEFICRFHQELIKFAQARKIVSFFSRLHPLLENQRWLLGIGSILPLGQTVSIDLSESLEIQLAHYRKGLRYDIRRARKKGVQAYRDASWTYYDDFINLYSKTMCRLGATQTYHFDRSYFNNLRDALGENLHLFVAEIDGIICSAALFVITGDIIQYHLSASHEDYLSLAPSKLLLDEARLWGNKAGAHYLHLGGGMGSEQDNLFRFKKGFSPLQHQFYVWNWIVMPAAYRTLVSAKKLSFKDNGQKIAAVNFFPEYRISL